MYTNSYFLKKKVQLGWHFLTAIPSRMAGRGGTRGTRTGADWLPSLQFWDQGSGAHRGQFCVLYSSPLDTTLCAGYTYLYHRDVLTPLHVADATVLGFHPYPNTEGVAGFIRHTNEDHSGHVVRFRNNNKIRKLRRQSKSKSFSGLAIWIEC